MSPSSTADSDLLAIPASVEDFRARSAALLDQETAIGRSRQAGALLLFEAALARHPFVLALEFTPLGGKGFNPWEVDNFFSSQVGPVDGKLRRAGSARNALRDHAEGKNLNDRKRETVRAFRSAKISLPTLEQAMAELGEAAALLFQGLGPQRAAQMVAGQPKATARDAEGLAQELGLPELATLLARAKIAAAAGSSKAPSKPTPSL